MTATRVLVVSDSHLSARTPEASANWDAVVAHVASVGHDLVIHAGDICADGPGSSGDNDLAVAATALDRIGTRLRVVPGNHDIGDNPFPKAAPDDPLFGGYEPDDHLVTRATLERFRNTLGPDHWALDLPGWRVVGLNSLLFGTGLDAEAAQWDWFADVLPEADDTPRRRLALVLHKPLASPPDRPDEAPGRYVPPAARDRLLGMVADGESSLGVVVSGHVHQHSQHAHDGVLHVWAPTTWATIPDRIQTVLGEKRCGVVELTLHDDGTLDATFVAPAGFTQNVILDTIPNPYAQS